MIKGNKNKGFTIVEIIFALAALALVCGIVLQVFILANKVNNRAINKQYAIVESGNIIEVINSFNNIDEIYTDEYFIKSKIKKEDGVIEIIDNSHVNGLLTNTIIKFEDGIYYISINTFMDNEKIIEEISNSVVLKE